jgi:hypothetical protein
MHPEIPLHITTVKPVPTKSIDLQSVFTGLISKLHPRQHPQNPPRHPTIRWVYRIPFLIDVREMRTRAADAVEREVRYL